MNIPYKFIVAVPATEATTNTRLMLCLARQITEVFGRHKVGVVAMTETGGVILKTAQNLHDGLKHLKLETIFENRKANDREDVKDDDVVQIVTTALLPELPVEVLVIVTTETSASMIPRIVLWNFLHVRNINPRIDMYLDEGEVGYVNCRSRSRDALHPGGYAAWASKVALGIS